jgi:hypothetical protein
LSGRAEDLVGINQLPRVPLERLVGAIGSGYMEKENLSSVGKTPEEQEAFNRHTVFVLKGLLDAIDQGVLDIRDLHFAGAKYEYENEDTNDENMMLFISGNFTGDLAPTSI